MRQRSLVQSVRLTVLHLLVTVLLLPFSATGSPSIAQTCEPSADEVTLFLEPNFGGACIIRQIGTYPNSAVIRLPDNTISSIKVGGKVQAILCTSEEYEGKCQAFYQNAATLPFWLDNDVSSANVIPRPEVRLPDSIFVGRSDTSEVFDQDRDQDGLRDDLEGLLAELLEPLLIFDSGENARRANEPILLFQVRPFGCVGENCPLPMIVIRWVFLFLRDGGYGPGTGHCAGFNDHPGDNDRATFVLTSTDKGRTWLLVEVHLGGERQSVNGTIVWPDPSRSPDGTMAGWLETVEFDRPEPPGQPNERHHPVIFMSAGKHHLFLHKGDWDDSPYSDVGFPIFDDCGDDVDGEGGSVIPNLRSIGLQDSRLNNVGEPDSHTESLFVNSLDDFFPQSDCPTGRSAWSAEHFCSGDTVPNGTNWLNTPVNFFVGQRSFNRLWVGMLTGNGDDSGTNSPIVLTIKQNGATKLDHVFPDTSQDDQEKGQANLYEVNVVAQGIDADQLTTRSSRSIF